MPGFRAESVHWVRMHALKLPCKLNVPDVIYARFLCCLWVVHVLERCFFVVTMLLQLQQYWSHLTRACRGIYAYQHLAVLPDLFDDIRMQKLADPSRQKCSLRTNPNLMHACMNPCHPSWLLICCWSVSLIVQQGKPYFGNLSIYNIHHRWL